MRKIIYTALGITSALAGLVSLPYLFMAMHDLFDALGGHLQEDIPKWDPYLAVGLMGSLCFGAFFMAFRLLRDTFAAKSTN